MRIPKYRADALNDGILDEMREDFESALRCERDDMTRMHFLFAVEDSGAYEDYVEYLTDAEMESIFKSVYGRGSMR